jgi:hypothetical protein
MDRTPSTIRALAPLGRRGSALAAAAALALVGAASLAAPRTDAGHSAARSKLIVETHRLFKVPAGSSRPDLFDTANGKPGTSHTRSPAPVSRRPFKIGAGDIPAEVSRARLGRVVRTSAEHWGLSAGRWTSAQAGVRDGSSVVGFSGRIPSGDLGLQIDWLQQRAGRRPRVVEQDVLLDPSQVWEQGPRHPDSEHFDLETVLLHELGHMSGIKKHEPRCTDSPMIEALAPGEWWRSSRDWFNHGCGTTPSSHASRRGHRRPSRQHL